MLIELHLRVEKFTFDIYITIIEKIYEKEEEDKNMLDFRTETFLMVCETMNFTEAARRLHITQPAVSQHIHFLEKEYDARLFSYHNKQLYMTDAGEILQIFHIASLIFPMVWWIGMRRGRAAAFIMPQRYAAVKRRGGRRGYFFNRHIISRFHLSEKQEIQMSAISAANGCISAASRPCRSTRGTPPTGHRDTP